MQAETRRERHIIPSMDALHSNPISESHRLLRLGLKFNFSMLRLLALLLTEQSKNETQIASTMHLGTEVLIKSEVSIRSVQSFCERFRTVQRCPAGKLKLSPAEENTIDREMAFHLGELH